MTVSQKISWFVVLISFIGACGFIWYLSGLKHKPMHERIHDATLLKKPAKPEPATGQAGDTIMTRINPYVLLTPPSVGDRAPNFRIDSSLTLQQWLNKQTDADQALLIFFQGKDCAVCIDQIKDINAHIDEFKAQKTSLMLIGPDAHEASKKLMSDIGSPIPLIADVDFLITQQYGLLDAQYNRTPWPSAILIDKNRDILAVWLDENRTRYFSDELLKRLEATNQPQDNKNHPDLDDQDDSQKN